MLNLSNSPWYMKGTHGVFLVCKNLDLAWFLEPETVIYSAIHVNSSTQVIMLQDFPVMSNLDMYLKLIKPISKLHIEFN